MTFHLAEIPKYVLIGWQLDVSQSDTVVENL